MTRTTRATRKRPPEHTHVPATMSAAAIDEFGPPSKLKVRTVPVPRPGPREVLIAVHAAGVGVWDAKIRDGSWAEGDVRFPLIAGTDGAGVIVEMGGPSRRLHVGDRVWAYQYDAPKGGFYAEYVVVGMDHVGVLPSRLNMVEGAAAAATGLTALQGCADHLEIRRGETVLIFGASGAVGTLAVQFAAKYRGARVIATASGTRARNLLHELGAATVIDGRRRDAPDLIDAAAPDGLDAILAFAGSPVLNACIKFLNARGRMAYPNGVEPEPRKRQRVRIIGYDAAVNAPALARLARAVEATRLLVPIAARFPLTQAARAHTRIERGHVLGRLVLRIR